MLPAAERLQKAAAAQADYLAGVAAVAAASAAALAAAASACVLASPVSGIAPGVVVAAAPSAAGATAVAGPKAAGAVGSAGAGTTTTGAGVTTTGSSFLPQAASATAATRDARTTTDLFIEFSLRTCCKTEITWWSLLREPWSPAKPNTTQAVYTKFVNPVFPLPLPPAGICIRICICVLRRRNRFQLCTTGRLASSHKFAVSISRCTAQQRAASPRR